MLGLRDKVIFLAARGEVYATLTVTFLFGGVDMIIAAKVVFLVIWMGAATSKLNKHFPFVISTMMSNNPLIRTKWLKRKFFEKFPDDLRPGRVSRVLAHFSTAIEMLVPLALFFSHGGWPTAIAAFVMVCFHFGILSAIPMGVPLEWNVFMIFGVLALFVAHADLGLSDLNNPAPGACCSSSRWHHRGPGQPVPAQDLVPARHAVLRRQLGHLVVVHQAVGQREDRTRTRRDREHAASQLERFYGSEEQAHDLPVQGICVPRVQLSRQGAAHPCAPRVGRMQRGRLRHHRRRAALQHRGRLEFRRRPHAQRATDRRDAGALPLRTGRGARHPARCATDPQAEAGIPLGRRGDGRIRARLCESRRHGDGAAVGRRHTGACRPVDARRHCAQIAIRPGLAIARSLAELSPRRRGP